jgi:hypothetical protein
MKSVLHTQLGNTDAALSDLALRIIAITGQSVPILRVCKILCFAGPIGRQLANRAIHGRTKMQGLVGAFRNARWIPGIQRPPGPNSSTT